MIEVGVRVEGSDVNSGDFLQILYFLHQLRAVDMVAFAVMLSEEIFPPY